MWTNDARRTSIYGESGGLPPQGLGPKDPFRTQVLVIPAVRGDVIPGTQDPLAVTYPKDALMPWDAKMNEYVFPVLVFVAIFLAEHSHMKMFK
jgi:hypothetical protein